MTSRLVDQWLNTEPTRNPLLCLIYFLSDESERKALEDILRGHEFTELVDKIITRESTHISSSCDNASTKTSGSKDPTKSLAKSPSQAKQTKEKCEKVI